MKHLIEMYLEEKKVGWAGSTLKSERHRLSAVADILNGDAKALWDALAHHAPYSRSTTWTRVTDFYSWAVEQGHAAAPNPYAAFRKKHARAFKGAYQPKAVDMSFEEAMERVESMQDPSSRALARKLLKGGLRYTESFTLSQDGIVTGKGNKQRRVFVGEEGPAFTATYETFRRHLAKVGLKPHSLRKICATELARQGLIEADLMKAMGWSSMATAKAYIQPLNDERLAEAFRRVHGGKHEGESVPSQVPVAS